MNISDHRQAIDHLDAQIVTLLNDLLDKDPATAMRLCRPEPISDELAKAEGDLVVSAVGDGQWVLGMVGVINAIIADPRKRLASHWCSRGDGEETLHGFGLVDVSGEPPVSS